MGLLKPIPAGLFGDKLRAGPWVLAAVHGPYGVYQASERTVPVLVQEPAPIGQMTTCPTVPAFAVPVSCYRQKCGQRPPEPCRPGIPRVLLHITSSVQ